MTSHTPPTIIAFASPKGGVGKSTSCLSLAGALAASRQTVTVIDFDQTETLWRWYCINDAARAIPNLIVEKGPTDNLGDFIQTIWNERSGYVLIDLAGALTDQMLRLAVFANLTITPAKLSEPDILEAKRLSTQLAEIATRINKPIAHRVLLNEVPSMLPHFQTYILSQIDQLGLSRFDTQIHYRAAYPESFMSGQPPHFADSKRSTIAKATEELDALVNEVLSIVHPNQQSLAA